MSDQINGDSSKRSSSQQLMKDIVTPHEHDVLSGRGNFVNYHAGNEHFRALVKKHKLAYVACPKPQKGKFSRLIVDEIRRRDPPGRFLKQDGSSKLWEDIGDKKALDKTRQALREGAPDIVRQLHGNSDTEDDGGEDHTEPSGGGSSSKGPIKSRSGNMQPHVDMSRSRQAPTLPQAYGMPDTTVSSQFVPPNSFSQQAQAAAAIGAYSGRESGSGRVVPGFSHGMGVDAATLAALQQRNGDLQRQMEAMYLAQQNTGSGSGGGGGGLNGGDFEPTPIGPSMIRVSDSGNNATPSPRAMAPPRNVPASLERADSLKFENIWSKESGAKPPTTTTKNNASSQHMSAMSLLSMDDMSADLSAVFDKSMTISDDGLPRSVPSNPSVTYGVLKSGDSSSRDAKRRAQSPSQGNTQAKYGASAASGFDYSMATIESQSTAGGGDPGLGNSMGMGMSLREFEDSKSTDK
eukprot:CAMPEP_0194047932 /NCGR_PEP_ID=MMETSP0009_2-20130614/26244_1 /TAXON_ID=210454 /ORGANISM="Grammatophora oceanica, Strain CCMP 410" /LENGTH=462 /DNA_ID=CAMNT_0038693691 /DNA_START=92 /DNA_END=1480 /DNA_ORIENTATION=+